ncbi:MAG: peptidoglycan-binding protein [Thermoanaerobacter sp.]|nr:peptidoglycan-binding protein [Thermoanaerobacter sp.]
MPSTIRLGSRGEAVARLQTILNDLGFNAGRVDGIFGPGTEAAVKRFQASHGLLVDGIVGPQTWGVLLSAQAKPSTIPEPVYYSQVDPRWKWIMFSNHGDRRQTIGNSGCGPTSAAMVVATFRNRNITPVEMARMAVENGFRTYNQGTAWTYFQWVAQKFSLRFKQTGSTDEAIAAIRSGALVVASMGPGYFTRSGHYILLWGTQGNMILCHDPANKQRNKAPNDLFRREARQYFCFWK